MQLFPKPSLCVSACLLGERCRYDGKVIQDQYVEGLKPWVDMNSFCPELAIGFGVPREKIQLEFVGCGVRLFQENSRQDWTLPMRSVCSQQVEEALCDGYILKSRSPSCGIGNVKVYGGIDGRDLLSSDGTGFFASCIKENNVSAIICNETDMALASYRAHFYTILFTEARFREANHDPSLQSLIRFHTDHKYLFMSYSPLLLKELGKIVANEQSSELEIVWTTYCGVMRQLLATLPSPGVIRNSLQHMLGYFSKKLLAREREHFLHLLSKLEEEPAYRRLLIEILNSWVERFGESYIARQVILHPYPDELK